MADELGLALNAPSLMYNTRRAHELSKWVKERGRGHAYHDALFKAYFVDGRDISDLGVLQALVEDLGLDGREAAAALADRTFRAAVDRDFSECRDLGVYAAPSFTAGERSLVGAQPYEGLERLVLDAGAEPTGASE